MRRCCLIVSALLVPASIMAQAPVVAPPAATLSLSEALQQAHNHNPLYQQRLNNTATARMQLRNAYGQLLPGASVSAGADYTGAGSANFGSGFIRQTSAVVGSNYSAGISWQIDGGRLVAPREQKANQRAVEEDIANEESGLRFSVTQQYLSVLQATAQVAVAKQQVERNQNFLDLASAKYRVGQGTLIEVRQAEVQKAQSDVALLRAVQAEAEAKLELFRRIGITPPLALEQIGLSDSFPVQEPHFDLDALLTQAKDQNPAIRALEARRHQADVGVTSAKTAFLPSLSMRAGWSAFTQQQTDGGLLLSQGLAGAIGSANSCVSQDSIRTGAGLTPIGTANCYAGAGLDPTGTALTPPARRAIQNSNNNFPFNFTKQPFNASLQISLPIFTGFGRSLRLQQAREQARDADETVRAQALQVESDVHGRYLGLSTAFRAIAVQAQSREAARDQLRLAQDRYRLGSGTALEVSDAQNSVQRAEGDYVNAIYDYHKTLAALEAAVGRPLRQ
ncbi:MAG: TolC family protein [Gemmatimonadota bacterium]|nr:TolC family protein [Gemmatimonadota bacterium]